MRSCVARADAATAQANYDYAKSTAQRWQDMLTSQSVSQQDTDTKVADMNAKRAMLASAQANVAHLNELVSYEAVSAPFDGVITARNVDVGTLVTAGGTPGSPGLSGELFHLEQTGTLRVFVDVPQDSAADVSTGTPVYLTTQQYPGGTLRARRARPARSIRSRARCASKSTSTTPTARCCPVRMRRRTSSSRAPRPRSSCPSARCCSGRTA